MKCVAWLFSIVLFFGIFLSFPAFSVPQRAAVIYSSYPKGSFLFKHEWDKIFQKKDIACDRYENTQMKILADKLDAYSIVIASSVCNYEHTQDFGEVKEPFMKFLRRGGIVLITDASYSSVLKQGICRWSPDFALGFEVASSHKKPSQKTRKLSWGDGAVLAQIPHSLLEEAQIVRHWAHLLPQSQKWQQALVDSDGKPVLVWQPIGKGLLVVCNYSNFARLLSQSLASNLIDNANTLVAVSRSELKIDKLDWGAVDLRKSKTQIVLHNIGQTKREFKIKFEINHGSEPPYSQTTTKTIFPGKTASFLWDYAFTERGKWKLNLTAWETGQDKSLFSLEKQQVIPDLISIFSWKRHVYQSTKQIEIDVDLHPEQPFDPTGSFLVADLEVSGIHSMKVKRPPVSGIIAIPLVGMPLGKGTITVRLLQGEKELGRKELSCSIAANPYVELLPDRSCNVGGKPFFPMGMYIVSWKHKGTGPILENMRAIAAGGFNMVHVGARTDEEFQKILAEAKRLKLMVIPEGKPAYQPEKYRGNQSILAWNPGDEPDGGGKKPKDVAKAVEAFREKDMSRPTYMTLCVPRTYDQYAKIADILAPDPYPIGTRKISSVSEYLEKLQQVVGNSKPIWAIPQAFGGYDNWRVPTPEEERNMTYQCLIHGSRGLVYYTYFDGRFEMEKHPELWDMMKQLAKEVRELSPLFLAGSPEVVRRAGVEKQILFLLKSFDKRQYLIAVNLSQEQADVKITLPKLYQGTLLEVFTGSQVKISNNNIELSFPPLGVCVYAVPRK